MQDDEYKSNTTTLLPVQIMGVAPTIEEHGYLRGEKEGEKKGKREGKREGKQEGKQEVALNLMKMGISLDVIREATRLFDEELQVLHAKSSG